MSERLRSSASVKDMAYRLVPESDVLEAAAELDRREARLTPCTWTEDEDGNCDTGCGHVFTLISDPPHDWVKFCCYCGHPVTVAALKG